MMKFFRKYNKALLAVFMVLLMIVFVGGSALTSLLEPSNDRVVANSNLGTLSYADHSEAESMTRILSFMGQNWNQPAPGMEAPLEELDWILLWREAEKMNLIPDKAARRAILGAASDVNDLARALGVRPEQVLDSMAKHVAIQRAAQAVGSAALPSEAQVLSAAHKVLDKISIETVILPAAAFVDEEAEFSEAQIQAQYESFREREAGAGLEFGYFVHPALKIQYLKIDSNIIAEKVGVANLEKKAKEYYTKNKNVLPEFRRPDEALAEAAEPVDQASPFLSWEEGKDAAMMAIRKQEGKAVAQRMADWLVQHTSEAWLGIAREKTGYRKAPEAIVDPEYFANLRFPTTISYPHALEVRTTDFFSKDDAHDVDGIGLAVFRGARGSFTSLATAAFQSQAIVPDLSVLEKVSNSDYLSMHETCSSPLTNVDGEVYVFRVVDQRLAHVPTSVDEVRDRVVADLRTIDAMEIVRAKAESLRSCATGGDLRESFDSDETLTALADSEHVLDSGFFESGPFSITTRYPAAKGEELTYTFLQGGIGRIPYEAGLECFALRDAPEPIAVIELPDRAAVMVVSLVDSSPAHIEDYNNMRSSFLGQIIQTRSQVAMREWFKSSNIRARTGFEPIRDN